SNDPVEHLQVAQQGAELWPEGGPGKPGEAGQQPLNGFFAREANCESRPGLKRYSCGGKGSLQPSQAIGLNRQNDSTDTATAGADRADQPGDKLKCWLAEPLHPIEHHKAPAWGRLKNLREGMPEPELLLERRLSAGMQLVACQPYKSVPTALSQSAD